MAQRTFSVSEMRKEFTHLPEQFEQEPGVVTVTRDGQPVMIILPYAVYKELLEIRESLKETIAVLKDEELMASFHESVKELAEGKGEPLDDVLKQFDWE